MPAYVIGEAEIINPEAMKAYGPMIVAAVKKFGGTLSRARRAAASARRRAGAQHPHHRVRERRDRAPLVRLARICRPPRRCGRAIPTCGCCWSTTSSKPTRSPTRMIRTSRDADPRVARTPCRCAALLLHALAPALLASPARAQERYPTPHHQARGRVRARRRRRHHGPAGGAAAAAQARRHRHRREQAGRRRPHRHGRGRARGARRLHAAGRRLRRPDRAAADEGRLSVRRAARHRQDRDDGGVRQCGGGQQGPAGQLDRRS